MDADDWIETDSLLGQALLRIFPTIQLLALDEQVRVFTPLLNVNTPPIPPGIYKTMRRIERMLGEHKIGHVALC